MEPGRDRQHPGVRRPPARIGRRVRAETGMTTRKNSQQSEEAQSLEYSRNFFRLWTLQTLRDTLRTPQGGRRVQGGARHSTQAAGPGVRQAGRQCPEGLSVLRGEPRQFLSLAQGLCARGRRWFNRQAAGCPLASEDHPPRDRRTGAASPADLSSRPGAHRVVPGALSRHHDLRRDRVPDSPSARAAPAPQPRRAPGGAHASL